MADKLSQRELAEFKEVFSMFDRDGDGTIDADELGTVMGSLGINPSDAEIQQMIEEVDTDKNGTIDFSEFCALMASKAGSQDPDTEAQTVFAMVDKDKDGFINVEDLAAMAAGIQWGNERAPNGEELEAMLQLHGANGRVDLATFKKIIFGTA